MAFAINMRRTWVFGLALLLFLAVVGPSCLVSAMSAFAMPTHSAPAAPSDCDGPASGMANCPHSDNGGAAADSIRSDQAPVEAVVAVVQDLPVDTSAPRLLTSSEAVSTPPQSHLTPLRL